jgi:hypothetical protein
VTDLAGNISNSAFTFGFFVLAGDANHDAIVDSTDLGILSLNWQQTNRNFGDGDFDYDGDVDVNDLNILAANWGQTPSGPTSATVPFDPSPVQLPVRTPRRRELSAVEIV